jgi:glycosyltransferase involved in cell wall biosynthesis
MPAPRIRLAIVHYHLRRGGVTRVIEHAAASLPDDRVATVVLSGEAPSGPKGPAVGRQRVVGGLGYAGPDAPHDARRLADDLERAARDALGGLPDLWHIHNHALGKNPALPGAVFELAGRGARLLLHLHDFAEDGRPAMYHRLKQAAGGEGPALYPVADHVHYAVLNDRDCTFLREACGEAARVHFLPNAVWVEQATAPEPAAAPPSRGGRLFLYPTRAIRRKNLGELLLWAAVAGPGDRFAATLAPENPEARPIYEEWVRFAGELDLPVDFEAGAGPGRTFAAVVRSADALITTSVAEGFGLAFLEPWLFGRPLAGRDLPDVTPSLRREGIDLSSLYAKVDVPLDWIGRDRLRGTLDAALGRLYAAYDVPLPADAVERALNGLAAEDRVDFGRLDEPLQRTVIRKVRGDATAAAALRPRRPDQDLPGAARVEANRRAVAERFGRAQYATRLLAIYRALLDAPCSGRIDRLPPEALVTRFLAPERINLLRS